MSLSRAVVLALALTAGLLFFRDRHRPARSPIEKESDVAPAAPEPAAPRAPVSAAPPAAAELQPVLDRVFDRAVTVDRSISPSFVSGDFDGDGAADLAVAVRLGRDDVRPVLHAGGERCPTEDASHVLPEGGRPAPAEATAGEILLAVVHGVDAEGWRSADARRCRLLKNAVGSGMRTRPLAGLPDAIRMSATRAHVGDVIEARRGGRPGVLLWTGAAYWWAGL
jgi:hypothetical protein